MSRAIFIDRDGTIGGTDEVTYPGNFKLFPNVEGAISRLKKSGNLIFSFTNQPGISRGEATEDDYGKELKRFGFDKVYLCPHQHEERCYCRKPATGMLLKAAKENNLRLEECVVIGDRWTDMIAAHDAGCMKILVKTGAGEAAFMKYQNQEYYGKWSEVIPDHVAKDFEEAVGWIMSNICKCKTED